MALQSWASCKTMGLSSFIKHSSLLFWDTSCIFGVCWQ